MINTTDITIGFCGAGSTGKTTVAELLAGREPYNLMYKPSIVRGVMESFQVNEKESILMSPEQQIDLQEAIFEAKIEQDQQPGDIVYDRTPIDQLAYFMIKCGQYILDPRFDNIWQRAIKAIKEYDLVVYFPVYDEIGYRDDGFRITRKAYQYTQDAVMHTALVKAGVQFMRMPFVTPEERVGIIMNGIKMYTRRKGR
jgi:nicotinamide riboside kinase